MRLSIPSGNDHPTPDDSVLQIPNRTQIDHLMTCQRNSFIICEDGASFVYSPIPGRPKAHASIIPLSLCDLQGSSPSPFPWQIGSKKYEIVLPPSPSFSDTASEILEAVSPVLLPSMASPAPPSTALLPSDLVQSSVFFDYTPQSDDFAKPSRSAYPSYNFLNNPGILDRPSQFKTEIRLRFEILSHGRVGSIIFFLGGGGELN